MILIGFSFVALLGVLTVSVFDHHATQSGCLASLLFGKECAPTDNVLAQIWHHSFPQQLTTATVAKVIFALLGLMVFAYQWCVHSGTAPPVPGRKRREFFLVAPSSFEYVRSWLALLEAQPDRAW